MKKIIALSLSTVILTTTFCVPIYADTQSSLLTDQQLHEYDSIHSRYICENDIQMFENFMKVTKYINTFIHFKNFAGAATDALSLGISAYNTVMGDTSSAISFSYDIASGYLSDGIAPQELGTVTADMVTAIKRNYSEAFNVTDLANLINDEREMYSNTFQKLSLKTIG